MARIAIGVGTTANNGTGDDIRVILTVNEDLTNSTVKVHYKKPNTSTSTIVDPTDIVDNSLVVYDIPKADNTSSGKWYFWVGVTNEDAMYATSTEAELVISQRKWN